MKTNCIIVAFLLSVTFQFSFAQMDDTQQLLDSAKSLFLKERGLAADELDKFNYEEIEVLLKKVIELEPQNPEAHYFLGYTYSRLNSRDGRSMINENLSNLYKSSAEFEKVIKITPEYNGQMIVLDPYSKLTSEWGSMAMSYYHNNKNDSSKWAFEEGKKRGGFSEFILQLNKNVLDACSKNAILISSGDNFSIPLWYLQIVENYRTDVSVVDISLLNAQWYPRFLSEKGIVNFDLPNATLDTIEYIPWKDSLIKINNFSWKLKPSYGNAYLLRGDRVFLSLLKQNEFRREVCFTIAFNEESRLSLAEYLSNRMIVEKLNTTNEKELNPKQYKQTLIQMLQLGTLVNTNSKDEKSIYNTLRYVLLLKANDELTKGRKKNTKALIKILDQYGCERSIPYENENWSKYAEYLKEQINTL